MKTRPSRNIPPIKVLRDLHALASLHGVELSYRSVLTAKRHQTSPQSLLGVLRALGAPIRNFADVTKALRAAKKERDSRWLEPVTVLWQGHPLRVPLRLPPGKKAARAECWLQLESGERKMWKADLRSRRGVAKVALPADLPLGYHRLRLRLAGRTLSTYLLRAPRRTFTPSRRDGRHTWGVFLPLYALRSARNWGVGDFADLQALLGWVAEQGGQFAGTLPLLATNLKELYQPSPYAPVSRLFWNELFLDIASVPELASSAKARRMLRSASVRRQLRALRQSRLVDYRRAMAVKRRVLEELARTLQSDGGERRAAFERYVRQHPILERYARFRAVCEKRRKSWWVWPPRLRRGRLSPRDFRRSACHYHLYVQWLAHEQLAQLSAEAERVGAGIYLDLPLGVSADAFDVWQERRLFALRAAAGAPPDSFFTRGQNWGFPPLHPARLREQGHRYFIHCVRNHLKYAGALRIDHIMGLHRLFWIPHGRPADDGAYVRYPADEFYAILALESQRHWAVVIGEDLGTVPPGVRPQMRRHGILRSYVLQFGISPKSRSALRAVPAKSVASLNTHDMPTFAGFWSGADIRDRVALGLLDRPGARRERVHRRKLKTALVKFLRRKGLLGKSQGGPSNVLRACLDSLASSRSQIVVLNLEDLWLNTEPQNVPGTTDERPNWRKKLRYSLEQMRRLTSLRRILRRVDTNRRSAAR